MEPKNHKKLKSGKSSSLHLHDVWFHVGFQGSASPLKTVGSGRLPCDFEDSGVL